MSQNNLLVIQFNHALLAEQPKKLEELATLYANTWKHDPNFQEFMICPTCQRYFSEQQVKAGVTTCSNEHEEIDLVDAWPLEDVMRTILEESDQPDFFGALAVVASPEPKIVGFAWGRVISTDHVRETWGAAITDKLCTHTEYCDVAYFDELAVDLSHRGQGVGKDLVHMVCGWMKDKHPHLLGLLRTHQTSPARFIYEKVGYQIFAGDTQHGNGRVMMWVNPVSSINLSVL